MTTNLFSSLRTSEKHSKLQFAPHELDLLSIALVICLFIARTIQHAIGLGTPFVSLQSESHGSDNYDQQSNQLYALPDLSLFMPFRFDATQNRVFAQAIEPDNKTTINVTTNNAQLCLYLAALSEPAMLLLLAKKGCPVRPLGAVNVCNRFELLEPELCRELFRDAGIAPDGAAPSSTLPVLSRLSVLAKFIQPARQVRRGIEIGIEVSIAMSQADEDGQASTKAIFRQEFTMLQFDKVGDRPSLPASKLKDEPTSQQAPTPAVQGDTKHPITLTISSAAPQVWARLCKDYNPIHFSPTLAKLLGQPGQLAHGNHAVGICVRAMSKLINDSSQPLVDGQIELKEKENDLIKRLVLEQMEDTTRGSSNWWMEVRFRRPIVLPAKFRPRLYDGADGFDVVDERTGKVNVEVNVGFM